MKIVAALLAAQREFPPIAKDAVNPFHKSRYATLDAVLSAVCPILHKHGLALTQSVGTPDRDEAGHLTAFTITTTLHHAESGETLSSSLPMPLAKSDPQGAGGAVTYARRYSLQLALGVCADEDDDGNSASKPSARPAKAAKPAPAASGGPVWPFGDNKGIPLSKLSGEQLLKGLDWLREKTHARPEYGKLIEQVETELDARTQGGYA